MQRWEYQSVSRTRTLKVGFSKNEWSDWSQEIDANKFGEEGWELVSVATYCNGKPVAGVTTDETWIFKRAK